MAALSMATQTNPRGDLEWMMHYQIPDEQVHKFWDSTVLVKPSKLPKSKTYPNLEVGNGLFTTIARKAGDYICAFPGSWVSKDLYTHHGASRSDAEYYAFRTMPEDGWWCMESLVYVTHPCNANKINAGQIQDEVQSTLCLSTTAHPTH